MDLNTSSDYFHESNFIFHFLRFLVGTVKGYGSSDDAMTYITSVEVTYQVKCEDNAEKLCDKTWTKEYDPAVTKVSRLDSLATSLVCTNYIFLFQASAIKEFQLFMEEGYEMITKIHVEEISPEEYVMIADGIPAKETPEDRWRGPSNLTMMCRYCTFNFAHLMKG